MNDEVRAQIFSSLPPEVRAEVKAAMADALRKQVNMISKTTNGDTISILADFLGYELSVYRLMDREHPPAAGQDGYYESFQKVLKQMEQIHYKSLNAKLKQGDAK